VWHESLEALDPEDPDSQQIEPIAAPEREPAVQPTLEANAAPAVQQALEAIAAPDEFAAAAAAAAAKRRRAAEAAADHRDAREGTSAAPTGWYPLPHYVHEDPSPLPPVQSEPQPGDD
jgi:hypothetical protein